jgi:predicted aconitase
MDIQQRQSVQGNRADKIHGRQGGFETLAIDLIGKLPQQFGVHRNEKRALSIFSK